MTSEQLAWNIRRHAVEMTHLSGAAHIGSILSLTDIIAVLFTDVMHVSPDHVSSNSSAHFILSKGHAGAAVYAALAEKGFFGKEELTAFYQNGSRLSGSASHHVPGIEFSTGSLGHGLSAGAGMAYAAKKEGRGKKVYVLLGDGECDEGAVWEAALFANHFRLNNLVAIIDHNHMQSLDFQENTLEMEDFGAKWKAFGWNVIEIDGNDHAQLKQAFSKAQDLSAQQPHKPTVIIANTIKGCGISFMENDVLWHYRFPHSGWEYDTAVNELHAAKPEGAEDPYTPDGIAHPTLPTSQDDIGNDHTCMATWKSDYPEPMHRVTAKSGTHEKVCKI